MKRIIFLSMLLATTIMQAKAETLNDSTVINFKNEVPALPSNVAKISGGLSCIYSKVQTPTQIHRGLFGFDFMLDYEHLWKKGMGFGINYVRNYTKCEGQGVTFNYVGASFVQSCMTKSGFRLETAYGLGYVHKHEDYPAGYIGYYEGYGSYNSSYYDYTQLMDEEYQYSQDGLGLMAKFGVEYAILPHCAIGVETNWLLHFFKSQNVSWVKEENKGNDFARFNIAAGFRFYF